MATEFNSNRIATAGDINCGNTTVRQYHYHISNDDRSSINLPVKSAKICPPPTPTFTGREDILETMFRYFDKHSNASTRALYILHGKGGAGKSQVARKFVSETSRHKFQRVYYVDATTEGTLEADYKLISNALGGGDSSEAGRRLLAASLSSASWLLIFDNADDTKIQYRNYLPTTGNIILTTRDRTLSNLAPRSSCELGDLSQSEAEEVFIRFLPYELSWEDRSAMAKIAKALHCFPLAITQAAAYISIFHSLTDYLDLYGRYQDDLMEQFQNTSDYDRSVYATWSISYERLGNLARTVLHIFSFTHHTGIPRDMFERVDYTLLDNVGTDLRDFVTRLLQSFQENGDWNGVKFGQVIFELQRYSLLDVDISNNTFTIHPLVQQWARWTSSKDPALRSLSDASQVILCLSIPEGGESHEYRYRYSVIQHLRRFDFTSEDLVNRLGHQACTKVGLALMDAGFYSEAVAIHSTAVDYLTGTLGMMHPETLRATISLVEAYTEAGRWKDAERRLLPIVNLPRTDGEASLEIPRAVESLAWVRLRQGRYADAVELFKQVLQQRQDVPTHSELRTLHTMSGLAEGYHLLGRYTDAEPLEEKVMEASERLLGDSHPDTLYAMHALAEGYRAQGRVDESINLFLRVLPKRKAILGASHPYTLVTMACLAYAYGNKDRLDDALVLEEEVYEASKSGLGEDHPDTLTAMHNLACNYHLQGRYDDAVALQAETVDKSRNKLGCRHHDTLGSVELLGDIYASLERPTQAMSLYMEAHSGYISMLGAGHPTTTRIARKVDDMDAQNNLTHGETSETVRLSRGKGLGIRRTVESVDTLPKSSNLRQRKERQRKTKHGYNAKSRTKLARKGVNSYRRTQDTLPRSSLNSEG